MGTDLRLKYHVDLFTWLNIKVRVVFAQLSSTWVPNQTECK